MLNDLNRYLHLNARFEIRKENCYVLKYKKDKTHSVLISSQIPQVIYSYKNPIWAFDYPLALTAQNINKLMVFLNMVINKNQIINETGISDKTLLDFDLRGIHKGLTSDDINKMLNKYGLSLKKAIRPVTVFVISEI